MLVIHLEEELWFLWLAVARMRGKVKEGRRKSERNLVSKDFTLRCFADLQ